MKYEDIPEPIRTQMQVDELIFGNGFAWKYKTGKWERIDPMKMELNPKTMNWEVKE